MMPVSVERLRRWLLAGASLLVVVIAGFLLYAHLRSHRLLSELPRKLGADIQQETNAFTWSQSVKGRTVFTLHAAKALQHKDGKYTMRDVGITVYGRGQQEGNRVDHIYGKEFELDQAAGVVKAMGEVHLDLQAPSKANDTSAEVSAKAGKEPVQSAQVIHVKTSGLVYLQKLATAATDQEIEFEYNGMTGHAVGADYNADSGVLILHSAVKVNGVEQGRPVLLTCSRAELDRATRKAVLAQAKYVTVDDKKKSGGAQQTVEARQATVWMRPDGSAERLVGENGVVVTEGNGSRMNAQRGEMWLNEDNRPRSLQMTGGVQYVSDDDMRQANGTFAEAKVAFDRQGHAEKAILTGAVHLNERTLPGAGLKTVQSERDLNAATVEMALSTDSSGRLRMREAKASDGARLKVTDPAKDGKGLRTSSMAGDLLTARFAMQNGRSSIQEVHGDGATKLEQRGGDGVVQTSSGDTLDVKFRESSTATAGQREEIDTAVQSGYVTVSRTVPAKSGKSAGAETDKAKAEKAVYDGGTQKVTLSGSVEMRNPDVTLWADRIVIDQKSGDAAADGAVKASYRQSGQGENLHVLAQRADLKKASDTALFYGTGGKPARLWQGGAQIESAVLEFERGQKRLIARGEGKGGPMAVHTVLVSVGSPHTDRPGGSAAGEALRRPAVVRIGSHEMVYSDDAKTAEFTGGVRVESADGVMLGEQATAYLQPAGTKKSMASPGDTDLMGGSVERVVLDGSIDIEQNGRRASGDHLIYTAADGVFVLTGTESQPPKVIDATRGAVTGRELRFRQQDASVVISNGDASGSSRRIRTETRVKRER